MAVLHLTAKSTRRESRTQHFGAARARAGVVLAAGLGLLSVEQPAWAEDASPDAQAICVEQYERAQEQRQKGALLEARTGLLACANPACPNFIQEDCQRWSAEIAAEIPTALFEVQSEGRVLRAVRISEGSRILTEQLDGQALELDPGSYTLRFEAPGKEVVTQTVVIARSEKDHPIRVDLPTLRAPVPPRSTPLAERSPPATGSRTLGWVLGGAGVAGVAGFAWLGSAGLAEEAKLKRDCAPDCSNADRRSVETKYVLADASLAVGVAGLALGAYLLLTAESEPRTPTRSASLHIQATHETGFVSWTEAF